MKKILLAVLLTVLLPVNICPVWGARVSCKAKLEGAYYDMKGGKAEGDVPELCIDVSGQSTSNLAFHAKLEGAEWDIAKMTQIDKAIEISRIDDSDIQVKFKYDYFKKTASDGSFEIRLPLYAKNFSDGFIHLKITDTPTYMENEDFLFAANLTGDLSFSYDEATEINFVGELVLSDIVIYDGQSFPADKDSEYQITLADNSFDFTEVPEIIGEGKYEGKVYGEIFTPKTILIKLSENTGTGKGTITVRGLKMMGNSMNKTSVPEFYISSARKTSFETDDEGTKTVYLRKRKYFSAGIEKVKEQTETTYTPSKKPADGNVLTFAVDSMSYNLNGEEVKTNAPCLLVGGRTLLPMRVLANALGVDDENISYDPATKTAHLKKGDIEIAISGYKGSLTVNGEPRAVTHPAEVYNSMMYLPVRDICGAFGIPDEDISYSPNTLMVKIKF